MTGYPTTERKGERLQVNLSALPHCPKPFQTPLSALCNSLSKEYHQHLLTLLPVTKHTVIFDDPDQVDDP